MIFIFLTFHEIFNHDFKLSPLQVMCICVCIGGIMDERFLQPARPAFLTLSALRIYILHFGKLLTHFLNCVH